MNIKQIRDVQNASPFQPYSLQLSDGSRIQVKHPELAMILPGGRSMVVAISDDVAPYIDLPRITSIKVGNGTRGWQKRKR